jgi:hypothetical protein
MRKAVLVSTCAGLIALGSIGAAAAQSSGGMDRSAAPAGNQTKATGMAAPHSNAMAMTHKKKAKKSKAKKATPAKATPAQSAPPKSSY